MYTEKERPSTVSLTDAGQVYSSHGRQHWQPLSTMLSETMVANTVTAHAVVLVAKVVEARGKVG